MRNKFYTSNDVYDSKVTFEERKLLAISFL